MVYLDPRLARGKVHNIRGEADQDVRRSKDREYCCCKYQVGWYIPATAILMPVVLGNRFVLREKQTKQR